MYHVELRTRLHVVRAFNLSPEQVNARFLTPMAAGVPFMYEDREWEPRKSKLTIYEAPELRPDQIGMGRGWANVEKTGTDVTKQMLTQPSRAAAGVAGRPAAIDQLKDRLIGRLSAGSLALVEIIDLAADLMSGYRVSEQLAASELVVWELLHQDGAQLERDGVEVAPEQWQTLLLSAASWQPGPGSVRLAPNALPA